MSSEFQTGWGKAAIHPEELSIGLWRQYYLRLDSVVHSRLMGVLQRQSFSSRISGTVRLYAVAISKK